MTEFDIFDVIGNGIESFGFVHRLVRRHEHELRVLVDEMFDQPRAGDPIDFDVFAGDPLHCFLRSPLAAARSSAVRSRQIQGVIFSIRYWPTASSAAKSMVTFIENGDQTKRCRKSRSGAFSLKRVNTISKNPPEFTAHSDVFAVTIAVHFRWSFAGSIGESTASLIAKAGRQRVCAVAGVTPVRASVIASVNLECRTSTIVSSAVRRMPVQSFGATAGVCGCGFRQKPARNAIARLAP